MRLLRQRFDVDAKDAKQTRLRNLEEDLEEARQKLVKLEENQLRYDDEMKKLKIEFHELEQRKGKKKEILEEMNHKL